MTTAAGIWMTAAIGIACGLGRESTAIISTLLVWAVFGAMQLLEPEPEADQTSRKSPDAT